MPKVMPETIRFNLLIYRILRVRLSWFSFLALLFALDKVFSICLVSSSRR